MNFYNTDSIEPIHKKVPRKRHKKQRTRPRTRDDFLARNKANESRETSTLSVEESKELGEVSEKYFFAAFSPGVPLPSWLSRIEKSTGYQDIHKATDGFIILSNGKKIRLQIKSSEKYKRKFLLNHEGEEFVVIVVSFHETIDELRQRALREMEETIRAWYSI